MKKVLKYCIICILLLLFLSSIIIFFKLVERRKYLENSRVLIISDKYFDNLVFSKLDKDIDNFCAKIGCVKEKYIIDVRDNPINDFVKCFSKIEERDSTIVILSPFATILFMNNNSYSLANLHYRPIIVGLGNKANNEAFNFIFDMNTNLIFKDLDKFLASINYTKGGVYIYNSINHRLYDTYLNTSMYALANLDELIDMKTTSKEECEALVSKATLVITSGFSDINRYLKYSKKGRTFVLPYCTDYLANNYYCVLPDIPRALKYALENYNPALGCQNKEMSYMIKYIK